LPAQFDDGFKDSILKDLPVPFRPESIRDRACVLEADLVAILELSMAGRSSIHELRKPYVPDDTVMKELLALARRLFGICPGCRLAEGSNESRGKRVPSIGCGSEVAINMTMLATIIGILAISASR